MIISFFIGILLGIMYFGGLYFSTKKFANVKSPILFMFLSLIVRMAFLILGFYYLSKSGYKNILIGLVGVILVRIIMVFNVKVSSPNVNAERK